MRVQSVSGLGVLSQVCDYLDIFELGGGGERMGEVRMCVFARARMFMYVCVCVRACVRAPVYVRAPVFVCECMYVCAPLCV